ncbi:hypothetical protein [Niallia sp.]|uniref:hypothetical protein n=1 Tax=Niallia sp. TaxID=2837523 RepID=UPI0028997773|nr:hypothetical protein [Niallia sp.]
MLWILSALIILGFSLFIHTQIQDLPENQMTVKCLPMLYGMSSSVAIGVLFGTIMPTELGMATILSIIVSFSFVLLIFLKCPIVAMIEAGASSFMGALMGAMLGVMLKEGEAVLMIIMVDAIFLLSSFIIYYIVKKYLPSKRRFTFNLLIVSATLSLGIIFLIGISYMLNSDELPIETKNSHHH